MSLHWCEAVCLMRYWGGQKEVGVDGVSLSKGGADKGVPGICKVIFVESSLGKSAIVIRDGEWLTGGGNPFIFWPGIILCLLFLDVCSVSPALLSLLILFLVLLVDASTFVLEVSKGLSNISGVGVLHVDTDTSVCVALVNVWGGVSDLGSRGICPQVGEGCKEGIGSLCEPVRPLIHGGVHGHLSNGGKGGRSYRSGTYCTGISIGIILSCKDRVLVAGASGV